MGLIAEYLLSFEPLPLLDVAEAVTEADLEIDVGQPNRDERPVLVVRATGASTDELQRALDSSPAVETWTLIDETDATGQYRVLPPTGHWESFKEATGDPDAFERIATTRSVVERIRVRPDGWLQTRRFADRDEFGDYCSFWRDAGATVSVRRLFRSTAETDPATALTDRQRTALRTAHEMGYFDVPRGASLAAVAEELGISASSASERLRRAHGRLVETVIDDV